MKLERGEFSCTGEYAVTIAYMISLMFELYDIESTIVMEAFEDYMLGTDEEVIIKDLALALKDHQS